MKKDDITTLCTPDFIQEIKRIVTNARQKAYAAINSAMVEAYWQMGKRIVEQEQQGRGRADYGSQLLKSLSKELTAEFGKGFSVNSLYYFRQFYLAFPEKLPTAWGILTWSHYKRLLSVSNANARTWYLKEAAEQMWSYRTLDRNIGSQYYERLLLSQHKDTVEDEMKTLTAPFDKDRMEFIKNPTVAEFIGLSPHSDFTETELEGAIIGNLQKFLLELGKGFSFVARQKLVRTEKKDYFIKLNVDGLLRGDYQSRMNGYATARQNGWMSANDIRELENLDRIPAELGGDLYLINGNMTKLEDAGIFADSAQKEEEDSDEEQEDLELEEQENAHPGNKRGNRRKSSQP